MQRYENIISLRKKAREERKRQRNIEQIMRTVIIISSNISLSFRLSLEFDVGQRLFAKLRYLRPDTYSGFAKLCAAYDYQSVVRVFCK